LSRRSRELAAALKADSANEQLRKQLAEHTAAQIQAEIGILEDRQRQYPTDLRIKARLGARYFAAKRYDDAIPLLQQAQHEGQSRAESRLLMGRCFFEKGFLEQAADTFRRALNELESSSGPIPLELHYWLGRTLETSGQHAEARKVYGRVIQIEYNFRDARQRLEALVAAEYK